MGCWCSGSLRIGFGGDEEEGMEVGDSARGPQRRKSFCFSWERRVGFSWRLEEKLFTFHKRERERSKEKVRRE